MLVIFWINLIKIKIVWLLGKLDLHSFWNRGKIEMLVIYSEYDGWKLKWTVLNSAGGKLMNGDSFNFKGVRRDNFRLLSFIPFFFRTADEHALDKSSAKLTCSDIPTSESCRKAMLCQGPCDQKKMHWCTRLLKRIWN